MIDDWRDRAACRGLTDLFYPVPVHPGRGGNFKKTDPYAKARACCASCPVNDECLADALLHESNATAAGMRAGLTPSQRRPLTRPGRTVACDVCGHDFVTWRSQARFCSPACQRRDWRQRGRDEERRKERRREQRAAS